MAIPVSSSSVPDCDTLGRKRALRQRTDERRDGSRAGTEEDRRTVRSHDEEELLRAAQSGDRRAAERLIEPYRKKIAGYLAKRTRTREDAEDLVQDVLSYVSQRLSSFRRECPFSHWVFRIAISRLTNYYERVIPRYTASESFEELAETDPARLQHHGPSVCPEQVVERKQSLETLLAAVREACNSHQEYTLLRRWDGESYEEIALVLQQTATTARSHYRRGMKNLVRHLSRRWAELPEDLQADLRELEKEEASTGETARGKAKQSLSCPDENA
jgi:RNA polymerase sigma-70 factor (ECF subfamily)